MDTICINCPLGCSIHIEEKSGEILVTGNTCKKGEIYGKTEYLHPLRSLTTLIRLDNGDYASCKTSEPIPKEKIFQVVNYISKIVIKSNVEIGDVAVKNILDLNVDIVITGKK